MKKLYLAATLLLASTAMVAQTNNSIFSNPVSMNDWSTVKVSYSPTTLEFDSSYNIDDWDFEGFTIEYLNGSNIVDGKPVFFEWGCGVEFMSMGDKERGSIDSSSYTIKQTLSITDLYIPLNLGYKIALNDNIVIMPYVGVKAQLNVLGKQLVEYRIAGTYDEEEVNMFDEEEMGDATLKRTWLGWHIGATIEFDKWNFGIRHGSGFTDEYFNDIDECKLTTTSFSLGYFF